MRAVVLALSLVATVASAGDDDFLSLKGHGGPVMALAVDPSGDGRLASASFDNAAALWAEGGPKWLERHDAAVTALAFGGNGDLFSAGDDFVIWHWSDKPPVELGRHKGKIRALSVSPDGRTLAAGSWDGTVGLWSLTGDAVQMVAVGAGVNDVAFDTQGVLFAATMDGRILRFDGDTPRVLAEQGFGVNRLAVHDGWLAYGAVDGATRVIDTETGAQIADFTLDRRPILALAYHPPTGQLAVGDGQGYIMIVDTEEWRIARDFRAMREGPVWALAFDRAGARLWAGGLDAVIYGWPVALLGEFDPVGDSRAFLTAPEEVGNGERQFLRKCSICHALSDDGTRKAGPHLAGIFGRPAGSLKGYRYSETLDQATIIWNDDSIDALFDLGPDHYIPGSKMPMQRITGAQDRADLIAYLKQATGGEEEK